MAGIGLSAIYIDATCFSVVGDLTSTFVVGRRVKADCGVDGYKFGTIETVSIDGTNTTVCLTATSDDLTSNIDQVWYGIVGGGAYDQSIPIHSHDGSEGSGGNAIGGAGQVLQAVATNITNVVSTSVTIPVATTPVSTDGVAFGSHSITLLKSNSIVRVQLIIPADSNNNGGTPVAFFHRSTTVLAITGAIATRDGVRPIPFDFYDTPGAGGTHIYSVRVGVTANTGYFNQIGADATPWGGTLFTNTTWLTLTEIGQ